jgi:hypothetical protein
MCLCQTTATINVCNLAFVRVVGIGLVFNRSQSVFRFPTQRAGERGQNNFIQLFVYDRKDSPGTVIPVSFKPVENVLGLGVTTVPTSNCVRSFDTPFFFHALSL